MELYGSLFCPENVTSTLSFTLFTILIIYPLHGKGGDDVDYDAFTFYYALLFIYLSFGFCDFVKLKNRCVTGCAADEI